VNAADARTTPAPDVAPARPGTLGIPAARIPSELDPASWVGLDAEEAECEAPFHHPENRDWRPLGGLEYEAVRASIVFYESLGSWRERGAGTELGYRNDVARKLGVYVGDVRLGRHGWEIARKARVRL
jgi:hypothetical protein